MPDNSQWWQNAQPGEKPWEAARRAKEAKAAPQDTRGVLRRAWDALSRPVIPVERGVRALMPEKEMGPVGENAAGVGIGLGRVAESLSSPAALGSLGTIGLLSRPGVMGDMLMAFLSGDMGWEAIKNIRRTNDTDYRDTLPREKTADYTAATAHGALAVAPWLHMGARAARNRPAAPKPSSGPIPDEFRVNVDPEVRAQVDLPLPRPESPIQGPQGRPAEPAAPRRVERPTDEAIREMEARNRAEEAAGQTSRQIEADRVQAAREAALAEEIEKIRQLREDPLTGDENVRRNRDVIWPEEVPAPPETPWELFEDALGAEIVPKPVKPPKFRDRRIPVEDPYKAVVDFILGEGGINIGATKKAGTFEDWRQSLPPATWRRFMRRKGGFSPDDVAMRLQEFGIEGENHLRDVLSQYRKQKPIRITKDEQMRQYEEAQAEWDRRMRDEIPPEWLEAMEIDSAKQGAPRFEAGKWPVDREGFLDYELMGVREPGQEGFARFRDDRGSEMPIGAGASRLTMDEPGEFTLVKVEYDTPGAGISSFYDVVEGFTGKRAIAEARKLHPEATKIELDIDDAPTSAFGRDAVREHTDAYYDKLGDMGLDPYWRNQQGFADFNPKKGYADEKFSTSVPLRISHEYDSLFGQTPFSDFFYDRIHGLNQGHALWRARQNWPGAKDIRPVSEFEYERGSRIQDGKKFNDESGFADTKPKNGNPLQLFADELLGAQNAQRQEAVGDLFQQILQADPARVSKRELLGLDKGKKKKSGSTPLLDTVKTQGSMFGE